MELVQSVERALNILQAFSYETPELRFVDIKEIVGLSKGTTFRLVHTLETRGFIVQDQTTGKYRLGPKALELGGIALSQMDLRKIAHPYLEEVCNATDATVHLVIEDKGEVLYIDKIDSPRAVIRMTSFIGQRMPMHSTGVGKALLAELPDSEVMYICNMKGMIRKTPKTITSLEKLKQDLALTRARGYALDDEENEEGLRCIAVPIRDYTGKAIASISMSSPITRMGDDLIPELSSYMKEIADKISYQMGYRK